MAAALSALVVRTNSCEEMIYDVLPDAEISLVEYVGLIARELGVEAHLVNLKPDLIDGYFPGYLDMEPLWREGPYSASYPNLFEMMQIPVTGYQTGYQFFASYPR